MTADPTAPRRSPRKGDLKEAAILETARRLLERRPLDSITVDELARGAGITRPTFYFYFASRSAVLRALLARVGQSLYDSSLSWLRRIDEAPDAAIRRAVVANLQVWRENGPVLRAAARAREGDAELSRFWNDLTEKYTAAIAAQIEKERAAGLAPPSPPRARDLARALVIMTERFTDDVSAQTLTAARERALADTLTTIWVRSIYGVRAAP